MSTGRDIPAGQEPGVREELTCLGERLERGRPVPSAAFRGQLRRRLLLTVQASHPRPARLRLLIAGYAGGGCLLLVIGAASAAGVGPLGG